MADSVKPSMLVLFPPTGKSIRFAITKYGFPHPGVLWYEESGSQFFTTLPYVIEQLDAPDSRASRFA